MAEDPTERPSNVFDSKRVATRYQILVEIAERQPAVSQREIAEAIGITTQAVSDYLQGLVGDGYVEKQGRGRYEVTQEGVDWLITQTDDLQDYVRHVADDVIGDVEVETAVATAPVDAGQQVSLAMRDGVIRATPGGTGAATAVAVTDADESEDVGVSDVEGVLDYELGTVTVLTVPSVEDGGSGAVDASTVGEHAEDALVAASGVESLVAAEKAGVTPDVRYGTPSAVTDAATRGVDVTLLVVEGRLAAHTETMQEQNIEYKVVEPTG